MNYKEFYSWCSKRAQDGCWSSRNAVIDKLNNLSIFKKGKYWNNGIGESITNDIVIPTTRLIRSKKGVSYLTKMEKVLLKEDE